MLIDNKTKHPNRPSTVYDYIKKFLGQGNFDIVSGYFSISMLNRFYREFNGPDKFRMILGNIIKDNKELEHTINLLEDNPGIDGGLHINADARNAVSFLEQEKLTIKTVRPNFCHAKSYIYEDKNNPDNNFYVAGSSNMTDAGFGIKSSSNVELNIVNKGGDTDFDEVLRWFDNLWKSDEAKLNIDGKLYKDEIISEIKKIYHEYNPYILYYKILYEFFRQDFVENDEKLQKEIKHLKETILWSRLFDFQQKGAMSLIKMLNTFNGAILADAVGLGKTWTALAVIKHFEIKGYETVVLCPKKLGYNWQRYNRKNNSIFKADKFDFTVRFHTDLQNERLSREGLTLNEYFQGNKQILFVIDESHNLRNDKSIRYEFLVEELLKMNEDVKVLMLSATPVNTKITDIRNQFKLIVKGEDAGFEKTKLGVNSLVSLFADIQKKLNTLNPEEVKDVRILRKTIGDKFFHFIDSLVLARTRQMIKKHNGDIIYFPKKAYPDNQYIGQKIIGDLSSFDDILERIEKINMTAYKPAYYTKQQGKVSVLEDEKQRQKYLVRMMYILLVKRLESCWFSFSETINSILGKHLNALDIVDQFIKGKNIDVDLSLDFEQNDEEDDDELNNLTLGKKNPIRVKDITYIKEFRKALEKDIEHLNELKRQLQKFKDQINKEQQIKNNHKTKDVKLERLIEKISNKQKNSENKKVVIFTVYRDTALYLYEQLTSRGFDKIAYISGSEWKNDRNIKSPKSFEPLLENFAPYTKLYKEKSWDYFYKDKNINPAKNYKEWFDLMTKYECHVIDQINNPIDIIIATDCLSEGQNLQDCDYLINYDIHWNPVRLIQRFGRIDRIGSPNTLITGVNFWPAESYAEYLTLKTRIETRMAYMALVGSDLDVPSTEDIEIMRLNNPLITEQEERMLKQLDEGKWDDIENNTNTLSFDKLTLEDYRAELLEFFKEKEKELKDIPNGVYSGFNAKPNIFQDEVPAGLIALIKYIGNKEKDDYEEDLYLLYTSKGKVSKFIDNAEILGILKEHKSQPRFVPVEIEQNDNDTLNSLSAQISKWMDFKAGKEQEDMILDMFSGGVEQKHKSKKQIMLEDKFRNENFELIAWFVIS